MDDYHQRKVDFLYSYEFSLKPNLDKKIKGIKDADPKAPNVVILKILQDFVNAENLYSFKDAYKRFRNFQKEHPDLIVDQEFRPFITDLLIAFCKETFLGKIKDIKGLINELIDVFLDYDSYANDIYDIFETSCRVSLEEIIQVYSRDDADVKNPKWELNIDNIDEAIRIMNQFGDLLQTLAAGSEVILGLFLKAHTIILNQLTTSFERNKHISVKFLNVMAEELRNLINVINNFKDEIRERVAQDDTDLKIDLMTISLACRVYLSSVNRLNHETTSQCSIIAVVIDALILQVDEPEFENFHLTGVEVSSPFSQNVYIQTEENLKLKKLSVIRALVTYKDNFDVFNTFKTIPESPFSITLSACTESNINLRHYAFKSLNIVLENVSKNEDLKTKFFEKKNLHTELLDLFLKNWESPVKGVTHQIDEVFKTMTTIIENDDQKSRSKKAFTDLKQKVVTLNVANSKKKYNALVILLDHMNVQDLLKENKGLIYELLASAGDFHTVSSVLLFERILVKLHALYNNDNNLSPESKFTRWVQYWIEEFLGCLEKEEFKTIRGIMNHIIPVVCNINHATSSYLINILMKKDLTKKSYLWCYVSLLKSARANTLIEYTEGQQAYRFKENIAGIQTNLVIDIPFLRKMMLNGNRGIMLSILELITTSTKPGEIPANFEYHLVLDYLRYNLRTSYSDFRNDTITVLKKFLVRIRRIYDSNLIKHFPPNNKRVSEEDLAKLGPKQTKSNFTVMLSFVKNVFGLLTHELRPEAEHEIIFPAIEIIKLIFHFFGLRDYSYKKSFMCKGTSFLYIINAFNPNFFNLLLFSLRSIWEPIRASAQELILGFPDDYEFVTKDYLHNVLLPTAIDLTKNPVIRNAEGGASLLAVIYKKFLHKIDFSLLKFNEKVKKYTEALPPSLNFLYYILGVLEERFQKMQESFLEDQTEYSNNLIHGLITSLGFLIQELPNYQQEEILNQNREFRRFFHVLSEIISSVLSYATKLSADNISTCILDNNTITRKFNEVQVNKTTATDCRGHILSDKPEDASKVAKLKNIENLLYGNTLMEGMDENAEFDSENIVVVSFYLMTRESGLLFQNISNLILTLDQINARVIENSDLQLLVNTYFHALLNVKHLGSIDRIAQGLSILCKSMYETKNPLLPNLAEELLDKILHALEQGDFRNVLRRSAGIPPAILCLLKSEPYGKKSRLFPKVMKKLFELAEKGSTEEVQVHALNVLKFVFQDSTLRADIESYLSQGFIVAVKGFSGSDWIVRNSALMLFSSIAKRTIGTEKVADQQSIRNSLNIVEFFTRAPQLVEFFLKEVQEYVTNENQQNSLYPSLYPIALIMSRLLPYDLKNNYLKKSIEIDAIQSTQAENEDHVIEGEEEDTPKELRKFITMEELSKFLPLFIRAAHNKNYMGRLMCARAVLPFIPYELIVNQIVQLLEMETLSETNCLKTDHNFAHGLLLQIYYILKNHFRLQDSYPNEANTFKRNLQILVAELSDRRYIMIHVRCPLIPSVYIQIMKKLLKYVGDNHNIIYEEIFAYIYGYCLQMVKEELKQESFRIPTDFGNSILRVKYLQYTLIYDRVVNKDLEAHKELLNLFVEKYITSFQQYRKDDNELFRTLLIYWNKYLKYLGPVSVRNEDKAFVLDLLCRILSENNFICTEFLPCISEILGIILNIGCEIVAKKNQVRGLLTCLDILISRFAQNSRLMKVLIKLYGALLPLHLQTGYDLETSNFLATYNSICHRYSHAVQIDFLRVAVIKSFKLSLKSIIDNVKDFDTFLSFSKIIIRLLQDEIPEIRSKMADFVSKVFRVHSDNFQFKFNPNYILEVYFHHILRRFETWGAVRQYKDQMALNQFILSYIFESEFDKYKELAHYEKRIFAVDKPNKFYSDFVVKRIAYNVYSEMIAKRIVSTYDLTTFLDSQKYKFKEVSERNLDKYLNEVITRDEFLFECILKRLYQDNLIKKLDHTESEFYKKLKSRQETLEPCLKFLLQP